MVYPIRGFSYYATWQNSYQPSKLNERLDHIEKMNGDWVALGDETKTTNKYSHDIHWTRNNVPKIDLERAIDEAQDRDLKVLVKPQLRMENWQPPHEPKNVDAYFREYQKWIVEYAKVAQEAGAEMFSIGNEQAGTVVPGNAKRWAKIVNAVDAVYDGTITYSAQYLNVDDAQMIWKLPAVDVIGVNAYYPVAPKNDRGATYQEMKSAWTSSDHFNGNNPIWSMADTFGNKSVIDYLGDLAVKLGKPVLHTEFGYTALDGTASHPAGKPGKKGPIDYQEQADAYRAYFDAWSNYTLPNDNVNQPITKNSFFLGTQIWWSIPPGHDDPRLHNYEGTPSEGVIRNKFGSDAPVSGKGGSGGGSNNGGGGSPTKGGGTPTKGGTPDTLSIDAYGTQAGGQFAKMKVLVDGKDYGTRTVDAKNKSYKFKVPDLDKASSLEIRFPNDASDKKGNDRNLFVTKVAADGETFKLSDATYERDSKADISGRSKLFWKGELYFDLDGNGGGNGGSGKSGAPAKPGGAPASGSKVIAEFGEVTVDHTGKWVSFNHTFKDPVVIALSPSFNHPDEISVRFESTGKHGFRAVLDEPSNRNGAHVPEKVSYLAVEEGSWKLPDGTKLQAGSMDTHKTPHDGFDWAPFNQSFDAPPVVLAQLQTYNGGDFASARKQNVSKNGFAVAIEEQESLAKSGHGTEEVGWVAIEEGSGTWSGHRYFADIKHNGATDEFSSLGFAKGFTAAPETYVQTRSYDGDDPVQVRELKTTKNAVNIVLQEDQTKDWETNHHAAEDMDVLALQGEGDLSGALWV